MSEEQRSETDRLTLLRRTDVAKALGVSLWTLNRWIASGLFPRPIYITNDSPARWRAIDVEAFIEKRRRARRVRPAPRGELKQYRGA